MSDVSEEQKENIIPNFDLFSHFFYSNNPIYLCNQWHEISMNNQIVNECKKKKLYLRDLSGMGSAFKDNAIRMAVKDRNTNKKMIKIFRECINQFN